MEKITAIYIYSRQPRKAVLTRPQYAGSMMTAKAKTRVSGIAGSSGLAKPDSRGQCPVTAVSDDRDDISAVGITKVMQGPG